MSDLNTNATTAQTQVEPTAAPAVPGSPEYNAKMMAKVDAADAALAESGRPAWLPENFKAPEDLVKSYTELQAEYTRLKQGGNKLEGDAPVKTEEAASQESANADNSFEKYSNEFYKTGALSAGSYEELAKMGVPKAYVDEYIRNAKVAQEYNTNNLMKDFGGMEKWTAVSDWAAKTLPQEDVAAINKILDSGDQGAIRQVLRGVYSQYDSSNASTQPKLLSGNVNGTSPVNAYGSRAEVTKDMSDPRYKVDPAFRKMVADKIAKSQINL